MATKKIDIGSDLIEEGKRVAGAVGTAAMISSIYNPPPRRALVDGKWELYKGEGLVDEKGQLIRGTNYYDLESDARGLYAGWSPKNRIAYTEQMIAAGFLNPDSVGDYAAELRAIQEMLDYSNAVGKEYRFALKDRLANGPTAARRIGQRRTYQTSNTQDLVSLANSVSQETIGRTLSEQEAAQFAQQYQQQQIAAQTAAYGGGTVMQPPSAEVAAQNFIKQARPQEEAGYKYLGYMNQLFDSIGAF
jgi:hypothetical protein